MMQHPHEIQFENSAARVRVLLLVLAVLVIVTRALPMPGLNGVSGYLPLHMFFETMAIIVAAMVFVLGWNSYRIKPDNRLLILSTLFLGVAVMDFFHMLSFQGMPDLVTPGSVQKSISYWFAARYLAVFALLAAALLPRAAVTSKTRYGVLVAMIALIVVFNIWFLYFPDSVPVTYVDGVGLTSFKIAAEYVLVAGYSLAGILLWRRSVDRHKTETLMLACAALVMALSEFFFTFYVDTTDIYNMLGHVYKVIAYGFLFKAIVLAGIDEPFQEVARLNRRVTATLDALPDMMFEISADCIIHDYRSHVAEQDLLAPPEVFLGRSTRDFLPDAAQVVFLEAMQQINQTGRATGLRYSLIMPKGERWFELTGSSLIGADIGTRYIIMVRDITEHQQSLLRNKALLDLANWSQELDEQTLARMTIDKVEALTHSKIGFLHLVSDDQLGIELLAWSAATSAGYCHAEHDNHYPVDKAGIWADCIHMKAPLVVNNYEQADNKKGSPEGHSRLTRFISVPVMDAGKVKLIIGVGNSDVDYRDDAVHTAQLFGNELYQIIQRRRAQRDADRSQRILRAALDHLPVGVAINTVGDDVHFEYMNDNFPLFYRTSRQALTNSANFWETVYENPEQRELMRQRVVADFESGDPQHMKWTNIPIPRDGSELRYITAQNVIVPEEGLSVSLVTDVTDSLRAESELRIAATAFESQEGILITDAQQRILRVNDSFEQASGYLQEEIAGRTPGMLSSGRQSPEFYEAMWARITSTGSWTGEVWNKRKNGEIYPQTLTITAVRNSAGEITHYVGDYVDLSELKQAEQTITKLSFYDSLTGLPNREKFLLQLRDSVAMAVAGARYAALLMIDLDHFKNINDTLGHSAGDVLLVNVAERLQRLMRPEDNIARYGGDEFVIILNALDADQSRAASLVQKIAQSILASLDTNYEIGVSSYYSTCSVGVTLFGAQGADPAELLKQADIALHQAKSSGRDQIGFFDPAWQAAVSERARLLGDLREGLRLHQFELYLQPQQDISGLVIGAEALVRWNHPVQGLVPPGEFISLSEETGLILPLGREIMEMGLGLLKRWQSDPLRRQLKLSINVSPHQFYEQDFAQHLLDDIKKFGLDARCVMLEFTESTLIKDIMQAQLTMKVLSDSGVQFAIDDFGTGYSSLAYLSELPLHQLKIDQSFVRHMATREKDAAIVRTIIDMAFTLNMQVLAEGVETEAQRAALLSQGCTTYQGYLIGKPMTVGAFEFYLAGQTANTDVQTAGKRPDNLTT